ncbi:hypothetical protein OV203_02605 [Nannocystis sp. ILAH1]|uniref:hypothetical protein n=1 Tax=Nannocystis sp. ILAH1 TaxID=2996789 RepID=UPI00226ED058|nr:hypothetical protein [Nannocystis sp. ILAH1]MCY0986003.1 hypothetical protein [Nannocystis sp. ILAH1]
MTPCTFDAMTRAIRDDDRHQLIDTFRVDDAGRDHVQIDLVERREAVELGEIDEDPDPDAAEMALASIARTLGFLDPDTVPAVVVMRCTLDHLERGAGHRKRVVEMRRLVDEVEEALAGGDITRALGVLATHRAADPLARTFEAAAPAPDDAMRGRVSTALFGGPR